MTTIILVRHGQSLGNAEKKFLGHTDLDLSEKGYLQAKYAGEYISKNFKIDKIYSSDLLRAYNTAKTIDGYLGLGVTKNKNLREIYAGSWEGNTFDRLMSEYKEDYSVWLTDIGSSRCSGGESVAELKDRVLSALTEIAKENNGKTVLVATHATVIRVLECTFKGFPLSEMKNIPWAENASVSVVEHSNNGWNLKTVNEHSFMGDLVTGNPSNV